MTMVRRAASLFLALCLLFSALTALAANEEVNILFEQAAAALKPPAVLALEMGEYALHPGESAYVPSVAPAITPFDEAETQVFPPIQGTFSTTDDTVVAVDESGRMTALAEGAALVGYHTAEGDAFFLVMVSRETPTEIAKNMAFVAQREYYQVKKARLPKYNQYAKWYYGKKNEVGWCSVFGIWCANAAGANPIRAKEAKEVPDSETLYLREGAVGKQYDGFFALERFGAIPRIGYMVIYADMSNAYRTVHIGIVVDVKDLGGGIYQVTTVEGNMSNSVKSYCYLYNSNLANHRVGTEKGLKLQWNMSELGDAEQTDPLLQYDLHTDHWSVFGFCETWK